VGAAIAYASAVDGARTVHRVDLEHRAEPDEWCVTVDGRRVLAFSGPSAWTQALSHRQELLELLAGTDPRVPDPPSPAARRG